MAINSILLVYSLYIENGNCIQSNPDPEP